MCACMRVVRKPYRSANIRMQHFIGELLYGKASVCSSNSFVAADYSSWTERGGGNLWVKEDNDDENKKNNDDDAEDWTLNSVSQQSGKPIHFLSPCCTASELGQAACCCHCAFGHTSLHNRHASVQASARLWANDVRVNAQCAQECQGRCLCWQSEDATILI